MTTFLLLIACGIVGGLLFFFLHIPGGTLLEIRAMALLVVAGALGAWFIFRSAGLDAGSAILATSPGGLQAVVGMASDLGTNAPAVLAFHLVPLYTVLLLAPFLGWLLHRLLPHS